MKMTVSLIALLTLTAGACSKDAKDDTSKPPAPAAEEAKPAPSAPKPAAAAASIDALFGEYESIRALLANDDGAGVAAHATKASAIATELAKTADDSSKPHLTAAAAAATKLATVDAGDFPALRLAFGELSRPLVALLEADTALAAKYHRFECPMAKGYKQWIQPRAELENPYMGQKMLACGSEVGRTE